MNKKIRLSLLPILLVSSLSGCTQIDNFYNTVKEIKIADFRNAYYREYVFESTNKLNISITYKDESVEEVDLNKVTGHLFDENGVEWSYKTPFVSGGQFSFNVSYMGVTSNTIVLEVNEEDAKAQEITLSLENYDIRTMDYNFGSIEVAPDNYNDELKVEFYRDDKVYDGVTCEYYNETSFFFYDDTAGTTTVKVSGELASDEDSYNVTNATTTISASRGYKDLTKRNCPTSGEAKLLVVPIWLQDSASYILLSKRETVRNDIQSVFFGEYSDLRCNSVKSFYEKESNGALTFTGTVSEWYESSFYAYNTNTSQSIGVDSEDLYKTRTLASTVATWFFENHPDISRKDYDSDGDGFIDALALVYAAPDNFAHDIPDYYRSLTNMWAYCTTGKEALDVDNPNVGRFVWVSYDFMYGYQSALNQTGRGYYKGSTTYSKLDTHTYIHETGHMFGLKDYYDYSNQYNPAGGFSMEDYNVGGHDPFSMFTLGWADAIIPSDTCRIKLKTFQESRQVLLLSSTLNSINSPFDEYVLVELYSPTGLNEFDVSHRYAPYGAAYPQGVNDVGIRVWHVDARLTKAKGFDTYSEELYYDPRVTGTYEHAFTNTYYVEGGKNDYISPVAKSTKNYNYAIYDLLTLIRNNKTISHSTNKIFDSSDLFKEGDAFSLDEYGTQFPQKEISQSTNNTLNNGSALGWSFLVESINNDEVILTVVKG